MTVAYILKKKIPINNLILNDEQVMRIEIPCINMIYVKRFSKSEITQQADEEGLDNNHDIGIIYKKQLKLKVIKK